MGVQLKKAFTAANDGGSGKPIEIAGDFNFSTDFSGHVGNGAVELIRSFDKGQTWWVVDTITETRGYRGREYGSGVLYDIRCSLFAAGRINALLSQ